MSTETQPLEVDDDLVAEDGEEAAEAPVEVAKTNLAKRRVIDNYLEERRLQKQLNDYDFDLKPYPPLKKPRRDHSRGFFVSARLSAVR
jgi:hypothetical protein